MLELQKQFLDRLAVIQSRQQALLTQTYELHEYPIPRLFIVLPKARRLRDNWRKPFSDQFRLYFLCECGTHTMSEDSRTPHEIHLARHRGYDLDRPTEFFDRYGSYILTMMYMIKYGFVAAGLVVPPLANLKIMDGIDDAQSHFTLIRKDIGNLVDDTIHFLQESRRIKDTGTDSAVDQMGLDKLEALEGADLRQLESYLKTRDKERVLGNLYRTVTLEGHVKWVCLDHYRANYRESAVKQLRDIVEVNRGKFVEEIGRIEMTLNSSTQAKQFYDALLKARGVQELKVTFGWDASMENLRVFAKAVIMANVVHLEINGKHLNNFSAPINKLRALSVDWDLTFKEKAIRTFNDFVQHCHALTTLELRIRGSGGDHHSVTQITTDIASRLQTLEVLKIVRENLCVNATISENRIQGVTMTIEHLGDLGLDDLSFIRLGHVTRLTIENTPQTETDERLAGILQASPKLNQLVIRCNEGRSLAMVDQVLSSRAKMILRTQGLSNLQTFELLPEKVSRTSNTRIRCLVSFAEEQEEEEGPTAATLNMCTWIHLQNQLPDSNMNPVYDFVRKYGWSIVCLEGAWTWSDEFASVLIHAIGGARGSRIERMDFNPLLLTAPGLDNLSNTILMSDKLTHLRVNFTGLNPDLLQMVELVLHRHGAILTTLGLHGSLPHRWLPRIVSSFPDRTCFPNLETFVLGPYTRSDIPASCIPWIVAMVSAAPPAAPGSSSSPSALLSWRPLKQISLKQMAMEPREWNQVIEAMDFSALEYLSLYRSNFPQEQVEGLFNRLLLEDPDLEEEEEDPPPLLPLATLNLSFTEVGGTGADVWTRRLRRKAPSINIVVGP
ncbi:hypothetical protein BGX31_009289 [Mortierella sp. GBA43]|nr:hypothetical protein BGX31_009289 [Mortierella sp. GBA43]